MKKYINIIIACMLLFTFASCESECIDTGNPSNSEYIKLNILTEGVNISRAPISGTSNAVDAVGAEVALSHLDVLIFEEDGSKEYYERVSTTQTTEGTITLKKLTQDFTQGTKYYLYVIANGNFLDNEGKNVFENESFTRSNLQSLSYTDERIHVTGSTVIENAPKYFLMDGVAFSGTSFQNEPDNIGTVVLNSGGSADTDLCVILRRAAAKVVVTLQKGNDVKFFENAHAGYYLRNLPYKTYVVADHASEPLQDYLRTPDKATGDFFMWNTTTSNEVTTINSVTITSYVYAHSWTDDDENDFYDKGTSLVVNIPVVYDDETYNNSYYQLPLTGGTKFERNHCYTVNATINAPGAEEISNPKQLSSLEYSTYDWTSVDVTVGGGQEVYYLKVNETNMEMYHVEQDNTTLMFASSSPVTVTLCTDENEGGYIPFYINKYGNETNVTNYYSLINGSVKVGALSGNITVNSQFRKENETTPVPENYTPRYFRLKVENETRQKAYVDVVQYPVICISNQLSRYSYRDDFVNNQGTIMTYANPYSGGKVNVSVTSSNGIWTGLTYGTGRDGGFFASKVRGDSNSDGTYRSNRYYYSNGGLRTYTTESNANIRMYKIDVTSTSDEYVVGRPRITDGITDPGLDNQRLVSPSFMIASRLAVITTSEGNLDGLNKGCSDTDDAKGGVRFDKENSKVVTVKATVEYENNGFWGSKTFKSASIVDDDAAYNIEFDELLKVYADHCKKYVEVDEKGVVYDDWRLPTAAEIQFIVDTQSKNSNATNVIDYLLNGLFYYSACGPVYNEKPNSAGKTIRCVRDVY